MSAVGLEQIELRNSCLLSDDLMGHVGFSSMVGLSFLRVHYRFGERNRRDAREIGIVINASARRANSKQCYACQKFIRENR